MDPKACDILIHAAFPVFADLPLNSPAPGMNELAAIFCALFGEFANVGRWSCSACSALWKLWMVKLASISSFVAVWTILALHQIRVKTFIVSDLFIYFPSLRVFIMAVWCGAASAELAVVFLSWEFTSCYATRLVLGLKSLLNTISLLRSIWVHKVWVCKRTSLCPAVNSVNTLSSFHRYTL